jgi:hypothetical protein
MSQTRRSLVIVRLFSLPSVADGCCSIGREGCRAVAAGRAAWALAAERSGCGVLSQSRLSSADPGPAAELGVESPRSLDRAGQLEEAVDGAGVAAQCRVDTGGVERGQPPAPRASHGTDRRDLLLQTTKRSVQAARAGTHPDTPLTTDDGLPGSGTRAVAPARASRQARSRTAARQTPASTHNRSQASPKSLSRSPLPRSSVAVTWRRSLPDVR